MSKLLLVAICVGLLGVFIYQRFLAVNQKADRKLTVVTSFYPVYFFTKQILGNEMSIVNITPPGAEPHDYEPTTQQIADIEHSRLVVINGVGLEPWAEKLTPELIKKNIKVIAVSESLANQEIEEEGGKIKDPHIWLSPSLAKNEVKVITDALISIDDTHRSIYEANAQTLLTKLDDLAKEFQTGLSTCKQKNIVTSHAAFGYLAHDYGLNQIAIQGISPEEEPSPKTMAEISDMVKKDNIQYIFFETLVPSRLADTIAKETGAKTLVFNPLEGLTKEEEVNGEDYFSIQRKNLMNLKTALQCNQ